MHHLTASEHHRELHLVAFFKKFLGVIDLYILVVRVDFRAKPDFL